MIFCGRETARAVSYSAVSPMIISSEGDLLGGDYVLIAKKFGDGIAVSLQ
jgi:hypothetical protein